MDETAYFDKYKGVRISSGSLLQRMNLSSDSLVPFHCFEACRKNSTCKLVSHDVTNGSQCTLWTVGHQMGYSPVYDSNSTVYTKRDCEYYFHTKFAAEFYKINASPYFIKFGQVAIALQSSLLGKFLDSILQDCFFETRCSSDILGKKKSIRSRSPR